MEKLTSAESNGCAGILKLKIAGPRSAALTGRCLKPKTDITNMAKASGLKKGIVLFGGGMLSNLKSL